MGVWSVLGREVELVVLRRKGGKRAGNDDGDERKGEVDGGDDSASGDTRVISAALAAVCNLVNEFSPLREVFMSSVFFRFSHPSLPGPPPRGSYTPPRSSP